MKKISIAITGLFVSIQVIGQNGKIGINTTTPEAMLHVKDSSVLFTGLLTLPVSPGNPPVSGAGTRMMWYPDKAAFRAGTVTGTEWNRNNIGIGSFAAGKSNRASGDYSIALGYFSDAFGDYSISMGYGADANEEYSTAIGHSTTASGFISTALGYNTTASNNFSTAIGGSTMASGYVSTAIGFGTTASNDYSTAMGNLTIASGVQSTAMGAVTVASGTNSTSMGESTIASGYASTASGYITTASGVGSTTQGIRSKAKGYASTVIGMNNDSILTTNETTASFTTPLFIIGNGDNNDNRSNAMVVQKNGNVGIGNFTPQYKLDVGDRMRLRGGGTAGTSAGIWLNNIDNSGQVGFFGVYSNDMIGWYGTGGASWNLMMNVNTGFVGIGTASPSQKLHVIGNICYTGSIGACSDIRYKKNIEPINQALNKILGLHGIYYLWNKEKYRDKGFTGERQLGFSAQEIEKLFPEIVFTDKQGFKSVDYGRLTPVLVEAVKTQQQQISEQQYQNKLQQHQIEYLQKQIDELKKKVIQKK